MHSLEFGKFGGEVNSLMICDISSAMTFTVVLMCSTFSPTGLLSNNAAWSLPSARPMVDFLLPFLVAQDSTHVLRAPNNEESWVWVVEEEVLPFNFEAAEKVCNGDACIFEDIDVNQLTRLFVLDEFQRALLDLRTPEFFAVYPPAVWRHESQHGMEMSTRGMRWLIGELLLMDGSAKAFLTMFNSLRREMLMLY
jgi:hypothetical protein